MRAGIRIALVACIGVLATRSASAALVDVEFVEIRDTPVGIMFSDCLKGEPPAAPADPAAAATADPAVTMGPPAPTDDDGVKDLKRVLVGWDGVRSPPVIRFIGMSADDTIARISKGQPGIPTALGPSWPMPNLSGFAIVKVGEKELVVTTPASFEHLTLAPLPEAAGHALDFKAPSTDLKLGDLQDKISDFHLTYDKEGSTLLQVNTPNERDAKSVDRYIWWRKPVVFAGADVGVKKLKFPAKLFDQTEITRKRNVLTAKTTLKDEMRDQAFIYLADAIKRELRRYQAK